MAQVKIYGLRKSLEKIRTEFSLAINDSLMEAFGLPENKRFHRYILLDKEDFIFPADRNDNYTIIELSIFEGRSVEAKKQLIRLLFSKITEKTCIDKQNIEITIFETPTSSWGIRGMPGDELALNYKVEI